MAGSGETRIRLPAGSLPVNQTPWSGDHAVISIVVDQEAVARTFPDAPGEIDVIAIREIGGPKIAKASFKFVEQRMHARKPAS